MKDIFATRARDDFGKVLVAFIESLESTFPKCTATKDWAMWYRNMVHGNDSKLEEGIQKWSDTLSQPLKKGCARYSKAVQSIIGCEPCVYHAVRYHDMNAATASSDFFTDLDMDEKLKSLNESDVKLFWEYMEELSRLSLQVTRTDPPRVPTSAEIKDDIQRRKGGAKATKSVFSQGTMDLWGSFCKLRGVRAHEKTNEALLAKAFQSSYGDGRVVADGCKEKDFEAYRAFTSQCSEWADSAEQKPLSQEEWDLLQKLASMTTMGNAIPPDMMKGIEGVASRLMQDIADGKASLDTLDVESIGNEVLHGVSSDEIDQFTKNIDKIVPALQSMRH